MGGFCLVFCDLDNVLIYLLKLCWNRVGFMSVSGIEQSGLVMHMHIASLFRFFSYIDLYRGLGSVPCSLGYTVSGVEQSGLVMHMHIASLFRFFSYIDLYRGLGSVPCSLAILRSIPCAVQ